MIGSGKYATVKRDSKVASRGMNPEILKKILEKSSQFLSSEPPCEPQSLKVALKIAGVEKIRSENLRLWSTWRPFDSSFE